MVLAHIRYPKSQSKNVLQLKQFLIRVLMICIVLLHVHMLRLHLM